ncbi:MAG: OB-fold domain-containing protein [Deltaproteobacteria bacterium]|nr:OB-fold domain-containing protein [Deltaproteobacteria bacterium]
MPESVVKYYYDQLGQGKIMARKCQKCTTITFPPTSACEQCGSTAQDWVELSGQGKLLFVTHGIAPPPNPRFADLAPYVYGHLRLEEGVYFQAIINGVEPDPAVLRELYEKGPVDVKADIVDIKGLNVLAFKIV